MVFSGPSGSNGRRESFLKDMAHDYKQELRQDLRLTQQLVMTPQLQLAIRLLQLSRMELLDAVRDELESNPVLEEEGGEEGGAEGDGAVAAVCGEGRREWRHIRLSRCDVWCAGRLSCAL